jgi:hypothetical protein
MTISKKVSGLSVGTFVTTAAGVGDITTRGKYRARRLIEKSVHFCYVPLMKKTYQYYEQFTGQQFAQLKMERLDGRAHGFVMGVFLCTCGKQKRLRVHSVLDGNTRSCGCLKSRRTKEIFTTHGDTGTTEYLAYAEMRKRCLNPNNHAYTRYGGRGITICQRWMDGYQNFLADMGRRPSPDHSLDRIDNEAGYSPENCRWALADTQAKNRRSSRMFTYEGRSYCMKDLAARLGVSLPTVRWRANAGMSGDEIAKDISDSGAQALASK